MTVMRVCGSCHYDGGDERECGMGDACRFPDQQGHERTTPGRHRSPDTAPRIAGYVRGWIWAGAIVGMLVPPVVLLGSTAAPVAHASPSTATPTPTEGDTSWRRTPADASGRAMLRLTAPSATSTSAASPVSTVTEPPVSASTPQGSPREQVGAFSGAPPVPSGTPGSSPTTGSTPSTPLASPPSTPQTTTQTPPPSTTPAATTTTTPSTTPTSPATETTTAPEETDVTLPTVIETTEVVEP